MQVTSAPTQMMPTSERPVPLAVRADLHTERVHYQGVGHWVIKDPVGLKYHRLRDEQWHLLQSMDGRRTLSELRERLRDEFPNHHWTLTEVQSLVSDLHQKGLVFSRRFGQSRSLEERRKKERWQKTKSTVSNFLFLRLPGWDPDWQLKILYPLFNWLYHPLTVLCSMSFVGMMMLWLLVKFDVFIHQLPEFEQFFGWPNVMYLWVILAVIKVIHEFGHGLTCHHYGGECHEIGVMLLVFSPTLYCDVSDSWMMKNKWHRILIGGAGMYIESILSAFALFVWWNTKPGLVHHLSLNIFFVTSVTTIIFNLNPLIRLDGYYMLSDWLEIPNLRQKADQMMLNTFGKVCLGIEPRPDPFMPEHGRGWFITYSIGAAIYRWVLLISISIFLYKVLEPYRLQNLGIILGVTSLGGMAMRSVVSVVKMIRAPRQQPLSKPRIFASLAILGVLLTAIAMIPIPFYIQAPFAIQPQDVCHVYTSTSGRLEQVLVQPGDEVIAGQPLAELSNVLKEDEQRQLQLEEDVQAARVRLYRSLGNPAQQFLAREQLRGIEKQLDEISQQIEQLTIVSKCTGTVVAAPSAEEPTVEQLREQLPHWYGEPLHERNLGAYFDEQTHLVSIAPSERMEALLLIDQADRADIEVGQEVRLKFDHLPDRTYTGVVSEISDRHEEFAPESLSNKAGGPMATVTDPQGREKLVSIAYQATVQLEQDTSLLLTGLRGSARCIITRRSTGEWVYRYLRRTFYFRL